MVTMMYTTLMYTARNGRGINCITDADIFDAIFNRKKLQKIKKITKNHQQIVSRCLDYIWFSSNSLKPTEVLDTVGVPAGALDKFDM